MRPPLIYIAMDCIMRYVFSLRVFKQMGAHTRQALGLPAFIHSFKHLLPVKLCLCFLTIKSILKVMGLYTMSVLRKYVFAVLCLQMHCFKSTTSYRCISCSFPNNLTNVINYPKTRFCFGRLGYSLLCSSLLLLLLL